MPETLAQWDERHRATAANGKPEPASIVLELLPLLRRGRALDVACGVGRHTLLLAQHGWHVTAVDGSPVALERLAESARKGKFAAAQRPSLTAKPGGEQAVIELVCGDLRRVPLPANDYDLILCVNYLQRNLFAHFVAALRWGGMLLLETFTKTQLRFAGGPHNPAYLLEPGELRRAFPDLHTVFYRELCAGQGIASLLARKEH